MPEALAVVQPAPVTALPMEFDIEHYRSMIYAHTNSERIRWWRAVLDPTYAPRSGVTLSQSGHEKWLREEQDTKSFRCIVQGAQVMQRYMPQGALQSGDLVVTSMPDELPIADEDWIIPIGRVDSGIAVRPDARTYVKREIRQRGVRLTAGAGTVSSVAAAVTGVGTVFTTFFAVGDVLMAGGQSFRVSAIADNTHLTLDGSPNPALGAHAYSKGVDTLTFTPVARIEEIRDAVKTYVLDVDYVLSADQQTIQWKSAVNSPSPGGYYSVYYRFYPKYIVLGDMSLQRKSVRGTAMPQRVIARLVQPDSYKT